MNEGDGILTKVAAAEAAAQLAAVENESGRTTDPVACIYVEMGHSGNS